MSAGVHCGVRFCVRGRCAEFPHIGLFQRAFPKGETPATVAPSHNGLTTTPPAVRYDTSQDPEPTLSSCSATTALRDTTSCVSPERLASRADCSLSLLHHSFVFSLGHFGPERARTAPATHVPLSRRSPATALNILYHRALTLRVETMFQGGLPTGLLPARRNLFNQSSS